MHATETAADDKVGKMLWIDNDAGNRRLLTQVFPNDGDLRLVGTVGEGVDCLMNEGPFCMVACELEMPEMNGLEFLKLAARLSPSSTLILTGRRHIPLCARSSIDAGHVNVFIQNPVNA